jgi:hypothetical protein
MELDFGQYCVLHPCQRKKKAMGQKEKGGSFAMVK